MKKVFILCLFLNFTSNAQTETPSPDTITPMNSSTSRFNNQISLGFIPEISKTSSSFSYSSIDFEQSAKILTTKIFDYNSNQSNLGLSATHRFSEKNLLGLSIRQTISGSAVTNYTAVALGAGFTDSNESKSGPTEPTLKFQRLIKESESSRILGTLEIDIPIGANKPGETKAGGAAYGIGIDMVKALDRAEFGLSFSYTSTDKLKSELKSGTTLTTTGRSKFFIAGGVNMYISNDSSIALGIFRNQYSKETASYSNGNQDFVSDAYAANGLLGSFVFKFDDDISMSASLSTYKTDVTDSIQGTTTVTSNEGAGKSISIGISAVF
jgi:hypothetical protein